MKNVKTKLRSFFRSITLVFFTTTLVLFLWNQNPYSLNRTIFSVYDNNTPNQEILISSSTSKQHLLEMLKR